MKKQDVSPRREGWRSAEERALSNDPLMPPSFTRTLRLKVKSESYGWLNAAAVEATQVWNWANATSMDAADRNRRAHAKWLSGADLCNLSADASECFEKIGADSIQRICCEYAQKRKQFKRLKLRFCSGCGCASALARQGAKRRGRRHEHRVR